MKFELAVLELFEQACLGSDFGAERPGFLGASFLVFFVYFVFWVAFVVQGLLQLQVRCGKD